MIPENEITELPITVEDTFRIIMSRGIAAKQGENVELGKENDRTV